MERHWHNDVVMLATIGIGAVLFINLSRLTLGWVNKHQEWPGPVLTLSRAAAALVTFN